MDMEERLYVCDTNVLLDTIEKLKDYKIVLLSHTLRELDKHKSSKDEDLAFRARKAVRYIKENRDMFVFDLKNYNGSELGKDFSSDYQDDNILMACIQNQYGIITKDVLLQYKAEGFHVEVIDFDNEKITDHSNYTGIRDIYIDESVESQKTLAYIYERQNIIENDMAENEYLAIWDKTKPTYSKVTNRINGYEAVDTFRFDGEKLVKLKYKTTEDLFMGKTKPLNIKQQIAFDLLQNKNIGVKLLLGNQGTGKDYLMVAHLLQSLQKEEINKIVFIRNIAPLKDAGQTGYLKGDLLEKMLGWSSPLIDAIGGEDAFKQPG